jgi:hypothetical protein
MGEKIPKLKKKFKKLKWENIPTLIHIREVLHPYRVSVTKDNKRLSR